MQISLHRRYNEQELRAAIAYILVNVFRFYGTDEVRALGFIALITPQILKSYWHLTVEDIQLFAEEVMAGVYGKLYGELRPNVLIEWLGEYSARRFDEIEGMAMASHYELKETPDNLTSDRATEELNALIKRIHTKSSWQE